jgi:hypothetical protein
MEAIIFMLPLPVPVFVTVLVCVSVSVAVFVAVVVLSRVVVTVSGLHPPSKPVSSKALVPAKKFLLDILFVFNFSVLLKFVSIKTGSGVDNRFLFPFAISSLSAA